MSTNNPRPSPRAGGMNHIEVYNEHKKALAKIASNDDASPTDVKDFMEQQGYMYFNAKALLRFVRMRLREETRRQRLKSVPWPARPSLGSKIMNSVSPEAPAAQSSDISSSDAVPPSSKAVAAQSSEISTSHDVSTSLDLHNKNTIYSKKLHSSKLHIVLIILDTCVLVITAVVVVDKVKYFVSSNEVISNGRRSSVWSSVSIR